MNSIKNEKNAICAKIKMFLQDWNNFEDVLLDIKLPENNELESTQPNLLR